MRAAIFALTIGLSLAIAAQATDPPSGWEFAGRTRPVATVEVWPRVTGELTRVAVQEGAAVKKGDLLAEIDPRAYRIDAEVARAKVKAAEAKVQTAKAAADRGRGLVKGKVTSPAELPGLEAGEADAEAALALAKAEADRAALKLSFTRITAPFDGRVSQIPAAAGTLAVAERTPLLTVVATDRLRVSFGVPEATLLRLRRDGLADPTKLAAAVGFAGEDGYPHTATLDGIGPEVDPRTGAAQFRATVANPDGLFSPGMSARVRLSPQAK